MRKRGLGFTVSQFSWFLPDFIQTLATCLILYFVCGINSWKIRTFHTFASQSVSLHQTQITQPQRSCTKCSVSMFFSPQQHSYMFDKILLIKWCFSGAIIMLSHSTCLPKKGLCLFILVSSHHRKTIFPNKHKWAAVGRSTKEQAQKRTFANHSLEMKLNRSKLN